MDKITAIKNEIERLMNRYDSEYDKDESEVKAAKGNVCHEILCFIDSLPEEPISESIDFERELYKWFGQVKDFTLGMRIAKHFYKAGAQCQKEVFEKNRLAACDRATKEEIEREQDFVDKVLIGEQRQPTFSDAIEYGIKWQKQKIIDKACNFLVDAGKYMKYSPIDDEYKFNAQQLVKDLRKYMEE